MKKLFKSLMLFAAAAMALTSCEQEPMTNFDENNTVTMTFVAGAPDSRTSVAIDGDVANFSWSTGDKVGFYYVDAEATGKKKKNSNAAVIDGNTATFTATFDAIENATSYNLAAFYPGGSWVSHADENPFNNVSVKISDKQNLLAGTFDPAADLMMSKPFMGIGLNSDNTKTLEFSRIAAIGKMNLKLTDMVAGEVIKSVKFSLAEGTHFNGPVTLDMENSTYELGTTGTTNAVTLNGSIEAAAVTPIFFTCFPGDYTGAYTIEVATNKATYSKEGTLSKALSFTAGDVLGFNATVGNRQKVDEDLSNYAGEYFIVAKRSTGNFFYMTPDLGTASTKRFTAVDAGSDDVNGIAADNESYIWTVVNNGATYTLQASNGKFVTWISNNSANLADTGKALVITKDEDKGCYKIVLSDDTTRVLSFNNTSGNNYFAFYIGTQVGDLYFIPVPNDPRLSLAQTEIEVGAAEGTATVGVNYANLTAADIKVTPEEGSFITSATINGNTLTFTYDENDEENERSSYIDVASGALSVTLNVTQKGIAGGDDEEGVQIVTIAQFLEKEESSTVWYQLTGTIASIVNTTYGNFNLTDETGTIYVYGLTATKVDTNDQSFSSLGLNVGDQVTIEGLRSSYNSTAQVGSGSTAPAYLISSVKYIQRNLSFDKTMVTLNFGDAFEQPTLTGTKIDDVTYESNNTAVATVNATTGAVEIKGVGTAMIAASAPKTETHAAGSASYTITVNEAGSTVVAGGRDDFNTVAKNSSYSTRTTTAGWKGTNCAAGAGGNDNNTNNSAIFKSLLGTDTSVRAFIMNGKTSAKGTITSPTLTTGCGTLELKYGNPYSESNAPKFKVEIKQNGAVVKEFTVSGGVKTQYTVQNWSADVNVAGDFQIVITNLSPTNSTSNKDRTAIWDVIWTGYNN